jgi:hypothetical protein
VTLYSIEGDEMRFLDVKTDEYFHDFPVYGKTEIGDPEKIAELLMALRDAISSAPKTGAWCFSPRHGMQIMGENGTTDYVICFQCFQYKVFRGTEKVQGYGLLNPVAEPTFDKILKDSGIPLSPK